MDRFNNALLGLFVALTLLLILAVADVLVASISIVLLAFAGILFGVFVNAVSGWIARHSPLPYHWAYGVFVVVLLALMTGGFYYTGSSISQQLSNLSGQLRESGERMIDRFQQYEWVQQYWPDASSEEILSQASNAFPQIWTALQSIAWGITGMVVVFFIGLYAAWDPDLYRGGLVKIIHPDKRPRARELLEKIHSTLGWWLLARMISMSVIGVITAIVLWLLDVPMPIALGVLAAFLTFIPNIGPILAAVPQVLLAAQVGRDTVVYVILFNIALQTVESYLLTPIIERYGVTLPPALTISTQLLMVVLVGPIGLMMAAPLLAVTMVVVQTLYVRDHLGDPHPGELAEST